MVCEGRRDEEGEVRGGRLGKVGLRFACRDEEDDDREGTKGWRTRWLVGWLAGSGKYIHAVSMYVCMYVYVVT